MLVVPPSCPVHCMQLQVVAHQSNQYALKTGADNVLLIEQRDVYFEDFP
jgi:hypothetical protein